MFINDQRSLFQRSKNHNLPLLLIIAFWWQISLFQLIESKSQHVEGIDSCGKYHFFKRSKANHNWFDHQNPLGLSIDQISFFKDHKSQQSLFELRYIELFWQKSLFQRSTKQKQTSQHNRDSGAIRQLWQISIFQRSKTNHNSVGSIAKPWCFQ